MNGVGSIIIVLIITKSNCKTDNNLLLSKKEVKKCIVQNVRKKVMVKV